MHNSDENKNSRTRRTVLKGAGIAAVLLLVLTALDLALYPCTFMRCDIHSISTGTYDDVYMGTSHGKMNIDPEAIGEINGRTGHNVCVGGQYPVDTYYIAKLMIERGHKPQRIIYEISPDYMVREKEEGNNYLLFFHEFPLSRTKLSYFAETVAACNFRTMLFPWYEYPLSYELPRIPETLTEKLSGDYSGEKLRTASQEYHASSGFIERYPVDSSGFTTDGLLIAAAEDILPENMDYLKKLIRLCREEGIEFTAVTTPLPLPLLQAGAQQYMEIWTLFDDFFAEENVRYINFNSAELFGMFTHELPAFTDMDGHMNGDAARAFSRVLAQYL